MEAFNNSSGRAFANRFAGSASDRRVPEHPALAFQATQEVAAKGLHRWGSSVGCWKGNRQTYVAAESRLGCWLATWPTAGSLLETLVIKRRHRSRAALPWGQAGARPALPVPQTGPSLGTVCPGKGQLPSSSHVTATPGASLAKKRPSRASRFPLPWKTRWGSWRRPLRLASRRCILPI